MSSTLQPFDEEVSTRKRKAKVLPDELSGLTELNFWKVVEFRLETDPQERYEVMVAYQVPIKDDNNNKTNESDVTPKNSYFPLSSLTLDQLRRFCREVGVPYVNKCNKFQCRKALWVLANHHKQREIDGL